MLFRLLIITSLCLTNNSLASDRKELLFSSEKGNHFRYFCENYFNAYNSIPGKLKIKALDINLARAYKFLINETIDGNCARIKGFSQLTKESRENIIELRPPLMEVKFLILARNKTVYDKLKKNLAPKDILIGMPAGAKFFQKLFEGTKTYEIGDAEIGINMLAAGRLDAVFAVPSLEVFKKLNAIKPFYLVQDPKLKFEIVTIINKKNLEHKEELERVLLILHKKRIIESIGEPEKIEKLTNDYIKRAPGGSL